jgi:hypothetical protein
VCSVGVAGSFKDLVVLTSTKENFWIAKLIAGVVLIIFFPELRIGFLTPNSMLHPICC